MCTFNQWLAAIILLRRPFMALTGLYFVTEVHKNTVQLSNQGPALVFSPVLRSLPADRGSPEDLIPKLSPNTVENQLDTTSWIHEDLQQFNIVFEQKMQFRLGPESIVAKNDGGIRLTRYSDRRFPPVLSIEAKRKKKKQMTSLETTYAHAAQICCEMLGQICHSTFYNNAIPEYEEAFVLHIRHCTFYLYYARFPHSYLRQIARLGTRPTDSRIVLHQSREYKMKSPGDQAQFFRLLVKLFNYMTSGKSHIS